jgi:glycosyltransferase involved in cell wall biosynthesis
MTIAVVIPAHNEVAFIETLLNSVRQQTRLPDEVVVVCDRCTDGTEERAKQVFSSFPSSTCCLTVAADAGDIAGARNAGICATVSDILVCLDADTCLHTTVLESVERAAHEGVVLGGFRMVPDRRYRRTLRETLLNHLWLGGINLCAWGLHNFVGTGCFFRRDLNLLYDDTWGWGEDIEFCNRVKRRLRGRRCRCLWNAPLVYCDRRFIERGYPQELWRRFGKGLDHLRRSHIARRKHVAGTRASVSDR